MASSKQLSINYTHSRGMAKNLGFETLNFNISKIVFINSIFAIAVFIMLLFYIFIMNYTTSQSYKLYQLKLQLNQVNTQIAGISGNTTENLDFAKLNLFAKNNGMVKSTGRDVIFTNEDFAKIP